MVVSVISSQILREEKKEGMWFLLVAIAALVLGAILLEVIEKKEKPKRDKGQTEAAPTAENDSSGFWFLTNETVAKWISVAAEYCRVSIVEEREKAHAFAILAKRDCFVFGIGLNEPACRRKKAAEVSLRREILRYDFADYGLPGLSVKNGADECAAFTAWAAERARELLRKNGVLVAVEDLRGACRRDGSKADYPQSGSVCRIAYAPKSSW